MTQENLNKLKKTKAFTLLPTLASKDIEWINWMKALDKDYDRSTSVSLFINLWQKRGNANARTLMLRQFMKDKYNVDLSEGIVDSVVDLGGGITDTISGVFKTAKITTFVIGGFILVAAGALVYSIVKTPSNAALLTPQGRTLKMLGKI